MPQRETVAGEATERSSTSNMTRFVSARGMISPELRQSFLLSSSTVFMFSIQMASTGPSNIIHLMFSCVTPVSLVSGCEMWRMSTAPMPSVHSPVARSKEPYSWFIVIDLGLSLYTRTFSKPEIHSPLSSLQRDMADCSTRNTLVLPPPDGPTVIMPWRTVVIS